VQGVQSPGLAPAAACRVASRRGAKKTLLIAHGENQGKAEEAVVAKAINGGRVVLVYWPKNTVRTRWRRWKRLQKKGFLREGKYLEKQALPK
jgi:hypothetical protein